MLSSATSNTPLGFPAPEQVPSESDSSTQPRTESRTFLDVFNPPVDASGISPGTSPAANPAASPLATGSYKASPRFGGISPEVGYSVNNFPVSFSGNEAHGTPGSPAALVFRSIGTNSPVLNIRKPSRGASINRELDDFHLGEPLNFGGSHYNHSLSPRRNSSLRQQSITEDDLFSAATTEEINNPVLFFAKNNQSSANPTSPGSVGSSGRRMSLVDVMSHVPLEDTVIETSVPLQECPADMIVPFINRPQEVQQLLKVPIHARMLHFIKSELGEEVYEKELIPLWTKTTRREMSDMEWLWKTKSILLKRSGTSRNCRDGRMWGDFCAMVDFNEDDTSIDPLEEWHQHNKSQEHMEKIGEEEE